VVRVRQSSGEAKCIAEAGAAVGTSEVESVPHNTWRNAEQVFDNPRRQIVSLCLAERGYRPPCPVRDITLFVSKTSECIARQHRRLQKCVCRDLVVKPVRFSTHVSCSSSAESAYLKWLL